VTYAVFGAVVYMVWTAQPIPIKLHQLALLCGAFWFGSRSIQDFFLAKQGKVRDSKR
jgi:hypothetical protein